MELDTILIVVGWCMWEELALPLTWPAGEKILVACNFTDREVSFEMPAEFPAGEILIGNYADAALKGEMVLRPYEAIAVRR